MFSNFGFLDLNTPDLIIILVIIVLLFGSRKLPELSKSIGTSIKELRKGLQDDDTVSTAKKSKPKTKKKPATKK